MIYKENEMEIYVSPGISLLILIRKWRNTVCSWNTAQEPDYLMGKPDGIIMGETSTKCL